MKKYLMMAIAVFALVSCKKEQTFNSGVFPGITGAGDEAIWVVYNHTITDKPYVTIKLASLVPPVSIGKFDSSYVLARQKEVSAYSYKFHKGGQVSLILKSSAGESIWTKQPDVKWEELDNNIFVYRNLNGVWTNIFIGFKDETRLLFKFKKSYFGDTTADKERFVMEVVYTMFK